MFCGERQRLASARRFLLHLGAADVLHRVALAVADELHCLLAAEKLSSGAKMDLQPLCRVRIIHVLRHVKFHAAQQIDRRLKCVHVYEHIAVRLKAGQRGKALLQALRRLRRRH